MNMRLTYPTVDAGSVVGQEWRNLTWFQRAMIRRWSRNLAASADYLSQNPMPQYVQTERRGGFITRMVDSQFEKAAR